MNGPSEIVGTKLLVVGYFPAFALAAATLAHLPLTAARMLALPAADIFRFLLGVGVEAVAVAGAAVLPFNFAHLAFRAAVIFAFVTALRHRSQACSPTASPSLKFPRSAITTTRRLHQEIVHGCRKPWLPCASSHVHHHRHGRDVHAHASISISSTDMKKVPMVSRGVASLIKEGVEIDSNSPSYGYTKLSELTINRWVAERPISTSFQFSARSVGL